MPYPRRALVLTLILSAGTAGASPGTHLTGRQAVTASRPAAQPMSRARAAVGRPQLQRLLDTVVRAGAPGIVAYVRDRHGTWLGASGFAVFKPKMRMRPNLRFRVGSVTKTFTAAIVLQLVGEGKLRLNDSVERWLPGLVPNGGGITVQELLNHTSGIPDYNDPTGLLAPRQVIAAPLAQPPLFPPGTSWSYSNTNYILLGLIAEAASGSTFASQVRSRILRPLKLTHTSFERSPTDTAMPAPYAHGYTRETRTAPAVDVTSSKGHWAAGAIVSTVSDLGRFYRAVLGGRLLRPDLLKKMRTTVAASATGPDRYGLGIEASTYACGLGWGHLGLVAGFETEVLATRNASRIVVAAVNTGSDWVAAPFGLAIGTMFCGR
jgi:D-alanyl-D-alanine carboxypeptidase